MAATHSRSFTELYLFTDTGSRKMISMKSIYDKPGDTVNIYKFKLHLMHPDPVVNTGLKTMLSSFAELDVSCVDTLNGVDKAIVITDYFEGIRFCQQAAAFYPESEFRVLVLTHHNKEWEVRHALDCGVSGYVLQRAVPAELMTAIRALGEARRYLGTSVAQLTNDARVDALTEREQEVLQLLGQGYCNKLIARELGIGVGTVKTHMSKLMAKLNVSARTSAVIVAAQRGLLRVDAEIKERLPYRESLKEEFMALKPQGYY